MIIINNEEKILELLNNLTIKVNNIEGKVSTIENDMSLVNIQLKEHGQILGELQTASEVHKADIDNLTHQVAHLSGEMKSNFEAVDKKLSNFENDLNFNQIVSSKNMTDIALLKYAK